MIPKVIHFCWFSGEPYPEKIKGCIESWKRVLPEYKLRKWEMKDIEEMNVPFVREAIRERKWAFAADYCRLYALFNEGGIYLDSDVYVKKSFDAFLNNSFFCATELSAPGCVNPEVAIMGSEKGHPLVEACLELYRKKHFIQSDDKLDQTPMPYVVCPVFERFGYLCKDVSMILQDGIHIYSTDFFVNSYSKKQEEVYAIHMVAHSWWEDPKYKTPGYLWLKKYHCSWLYPVLFFLNQKIRPRNNHK